MFFKDRANGNNCSIRCYCSVHDKLLFFLYRGDRRSQAISIDRLWSVRFVRRVYFNRKNRFHNLFFIIVRSRNHRIYTISPPEIRIF